MGSSKSRPQLSSQPLHRLTSIFQDISRNLLSNDDLINALIPLSVALHLTKQSRELGLISLFAWLVLLGATYAVKKTSHLGVDAIINTLGSKKRKILALFAAFICIFYAFLMLKGSWDYWAPYANLPTTEGRWFPIGFDFTVRGRGWYETQDIPVPFFMRWLETVFNDGMEYEKLPKVVPYFVMPLSMALLLFRFVQAGVSIWNGKMDMLIVSHEAEEEVEEANKAMVAEEIK